jgi:hypothetical protein
MAYLKKKYEKKITSTDHVFGRSIGTDQQE